VISPFCRTRDDIIYMLLTDIINSMRPRQWVKNLVIFGALLFVPGAVKKPECWLYAVIGFAAFCLLSGAVYLINDIVDKPKDVLHPRKKLRPIAAGRVQAPVAIASAAIVAIIGFALCYWVDTIGNKPEFIPETSKEPYGLTIIAASYVILMLLYSFWLKREIILDVLILSVGFVIRAVAGGFALDVRISPWLLATTLFISLFLALGKRRAEIKELEDAAGSHRDVLDTYSVQLIDSLLVVSAAANIMSYSLYTFLHDFSNGGVNGGQFGGDIRMMFTVPFVIYGIFRYLHLIIHYDIGERPHEVITHDDGRLIFCVIGWVITVLFMLSLK
jgi:4-hydroxybenzoate polyprenyltransferase